MSIVRKYLCTRNNTPDMPSESRAKLKCIEVMGFRVILITIYPLVIEEECYRKQCDFGFLSNKYSFDKGLSWLQLQSRFS